jgi:hypothetical protein
MQSAFQLLGFWAAAFVTLCLALLLLNIFYALIGNDLALRTLRQELIIAGLSSLIEGGSAWLISSFLPSAARALIIPALVVAVIYKLSHLEDWSRYDIALFLAFQLTITSSSVAFFFGHFQAGIAILGVFAGTLTLIATIARGL